MAATIADILSKKFPETLWTVTERDYNSLIWYPENTQPKPTAEEIFQYEDEVDLEVRWDKVRIRRNKFLTVCDWTQLPDSPLTLEKKAEWTTYRQQLRDITLQQVEPEQVIWPISPA
jgi:hypothetical protein